MYVVVEVAPLPTPGQKQYGQLPNLDIEGTQGEHRNDIIPPFWFRTSPSFRSVLIPVAVKHVNGSEDKEPLKSFDSDLPTVQYEVSLANLQFVLALHSTAMAAGNDVAHNRSQ